MKVKFLSLIITGLIVAFPAFSWSEENVDQKDYKVYDLGEIVISEEKPAVKEISITNEITAEDIKATNSRTVDEALMYVPGIRVTTGRKDEPEISIHGFSQQKTLILIDGVPYYETKYGKLQLNQIPTDMIAKIEVIKGAPSVLYGPNAEAGVINIITKKPSEKPSASANIELGELNYNRASVSHGMKVGIFNYWLNYVHTERDAWRLSEDFDPAIGTLTTKMGKKKTFANASFEDGGYFRDNSDLKSDSLWAKFGIEKDSSSEYYVNLHYINTEKGQPDSIYDNMVFADYSQLARWDKYDDWGLDLNGKQAITNKLTLQGKLFYHNHEENYDSFQDTAYCNFLARSTYKDYLAGGSIFANYKPVEWNILSLAFHYRKDSHKQRDNDFLPFEESISHTGSVALENEFNYVKRLSIVAGLSYDWFEVSDTETTDDDNNLVALDTPDTKDTFNPMIGFVYRFTDTAKLFGSVAKKTRFPTLNQLYSSKSGNQKLEEEKSINYTLGASRNFFDSIWTELSFFHHDISDWISRDCIADEMLYQNVEAVKMYGLEFNSEFYPMENLTLKFAYTYNYARNKSDGRLADYVVNVPENKLDLGIRYALPYLETKLDVTGVYLDEMYSDLPTPSDPDVVETESDNYWLFNVRITQPIMKYLEAYVACNNLFDNDYESEYGFPGRGRNIWIGLTAKY